MTGREALADALGVHLLCSCPALLDASWSEHLADAVLAHIAAVLHDPATIEAVMATYPGQLGRNQRARHAIDILDERLGVPHD